MISSRGRRPDFQYRGRCGARRIFQRGRGGALRHRHPGKPAHAQHGLSGQPADELPHRHHDRRRGRTRRRSVRRRREHRGAPGGHRAGRRHLHFAHRLRTGREQILRAVRRYRRTAGQEYSDAGSRLQVRNAARRSQGDVDRRRSRHKKPVKRAGWIVPVAIAAPVAASHRGVAVIVYLAAASATMRRQPSSNSASVAARSECAAAKRTIPTGFAASRAGGPRNDSFHC